VVVAGQLASGVEERSAAADAPVGVGPGVVGQGSEQQAVRRRVVVGERTERRREGAEVGRRIA
jgi:hypothetical protein